MIYLLDVNALLAMGCERHIHHQRVTQWRESLASSVRLATCAITELGFVRIASGKAALAKNLTHAQTELQRVKASEDLLFLGDALGADRLPQWVRTSAQTTDGHLLELARVHQARLATLDAGIPGAEFIPADPGPRWEVRDAPFTYAAATGAV
jgi:predicted nucleic acid-binding protein